MIKESRQRIILDQVNTQQTVNVEELSNMLKVSEATIRRDLIDLESKGAVSRVHGGASLKHSAPEPFTMARSGLQRDAKRRIGKAAAELVKDGETIIISTGTTTEAMIPFLADKANLTVITNALNIAYRLTQYEHITTVVLGGVMRARELDLLGHITESSLSELVATRLFRGVYGIHPRHGLTGSDILHIRTDQRMIQMTQELIIVADHTKICRVGSVQLAPINAASVIITDTDAPEEEVARLRELGVNVMLV